MSDQRFDFGIGNAALRKVGVIEREGQARSVLDEPYLFTVILGSRAVVSARSVLLTA